MILNKEQFNMRKCTNISALTNALLDNDVTVDTDVFGNTALID